MVGGLDSSHERQDNRENSSFGVKEGHVIGVKEGHVNDGGVLIVLL